MHWPSMLDDYSMMTYHLYYIYKKIIITATILQIRHRRVTETGDNLNQVDHKTVMSC